MGGLSAREGVTRADKPPVAPNPLVDVLSPTALQFAACRLYITVCSLQSRGIENSSRLAVIEATGSRC